MSKILVVDDNAANRALAQATLEDEGHEVIVAANGEDGITSFATEKPDCVLLDVRMPDLDGFAVCARIRELPEGAHTPVVFLTALRDVETFDNALRVGGDDFLTKPVRPAELVVRVQAALKLRQMGAELREHYELVRKQRDALMRLQLQKERLSAFVVHDLKNPVASMDLHAQLLLADKQLPEHARDAARHIRSEARSLTRLIMNLLDISKSEEGKLEPRRSRVELSVLVEQVLEGIELKAQLSDVRIRRSTDAPPVTADADLLRRVLENLLDNAVRYAPRGSDVVLAARVRGSDVEIDVSDAGPGIAPEMRARVFDAYVQTEAEGGLRTGRGLGLTFCKLAVEAHGGSIWVEDANPGTRFVLRLPHAAT